MRSQRPGRARARPWPAILACTVALLSSAPASAEKTTEPASVLRVAVLDFSVQSADPLLEESRSLAEALRARLAADGRFEVLDGAAAPPHGGGGMRDSVIRRFAREVGADFVVTGQLTQLVSGGRVDLAVRLVAAAPGVEGDTQVVTAPSPDALSDRMEQVADRIVDRVVGSPPARVVRIEITGAPGFEPQLRGRLETRVGEPYDPLKLRSDLAMLRESAALVSADAHTERTPEGVVVHFDLVLAAPSQQKGTTSERIAEVRIRGNRRIDAEAIRARISTEPGQLFDPARIARDIKAVYALGFFRDVRVLTDTSPEGRIVIFEVVEQPIVRQISISGNDNVDGDKIRDALTLTTGASLDYPLLYENRERIEAIYRAAGYYLAKVDFEIEPLGESSVGIHFLVTENEKLKLRRIEFSGNEHFDDDELLEGFQTKRWRFWSIATSWFDKSGTYSEPLFRQDLRRIERKYNDAGFLQAKVGEPDVIPSEDGLVVAVKIHEGDQFRVGKISVTGDTTVDIDALREKLKLKEGDIFNRSYLNDDITALTEHYQDRGFYFAQVTPHSNLSETSDVVDVAFEVRKGPLYFIRRIDIEGNGITVDPVIRREIPIAEGQLYSQRKVLLARTRVERLGYFEEVNFETEPTDEPDQLDLKVKVVERPTGSFSFGAGYSSQDGLVVTGSLAQSNLFGRGYGANVSIDLGGSTQRFFVNLSAPYFLGTSYSLSTTFSRTNIEFQDFSQEQIGADLVLGHALTEDGTSRGFLRYGLNVRRLSRDTNQIAAAVILRELLQDRISSSLVGLSVVSDTRDDRLAPTAGHQIGLSLEGAGIGGFSRFARLEGRGTFFLGAPRWLFDRSTFVVAGRAGWQVPFNTIGDFTTPSFDSTQVLPQVQPLDQIDSDVRLPLTERYFLGGLGQFQLRGFKARSVGPRRPILVPAGFLDPAKAGLFAPLGVDPATGKCVDTAGFGGNGNGQCNDINAKNIKDFKDLNETDVIGGNKFITTSFEYRFPVSETLGLQGVAFLDMGNAFDERTYNLFDVTQWRYGTGAGVQWFSPFGPLAVVLGFPLDRLSVEKSPVFEFSIGGSAF